MKKETECEIELEDEVSYASDFKVHVEKNIYIEADPKQYILKQYSGKTDKKGKETYVVLGYFGKLEAVVSYLRERKTKESTARILKDLFTEIQEISQWVRKQVNGDE